MRALAPWLLLLVSAPALAHTRPPALTRVAQRADGSVVATATWGLVFRDDRQWSLGCAAAYGVDADVEDAHLALDGAGRIVLATFDGLRESDDGCAFTRAPGRLGEGWVVAVAPDGEGGVYAALTEITGSDQLYHRTRDGSWGPVGPPLDVLVADLMVTDEAIWLATFRPLTADQDTQLFLARSDDGGETFTSVEVAREGSEWYARLLAERDGVVHLVVRHFDGEPAPERVLRFDSATERFAQVHSLPLVEDAFWSAEGLWLISRAEGLHLSTDGVAFERRHGVSGRCLGMLDGALTACVDPLAEGATLAAIDSDATTPVARLDALDHVRSCPAGTDTDAVCPAFREALAEDVGVAVDGVPPPGEGGGCSVGGAPTIPWGLVVVAQLARRRRTKSSARAASPNP